MTNGTPLTYRRTKAGEWVAYGPAAAVRLGRVTVAKKDGGTKTETVTRVGRPFRVDGVECAYGYLAPRITDRRTSNGGCPTDGDCWSFSAITYCHECGKG